MRVSTRFRARLLVPSLVLVLLGACAGPQVRYWKADEIGDVKAMHVYLHAEDGTARTVSPERVRRLLAVKERISAASGQRAQLVIAEGDQPNAFAGTVRGVPTVAVNVAMLDLFDDDLDAYATIVGHEFAHLRLNHGWQRERRETTRQGFASVIGFVLGAVGIPLGGTIGDLATMAVSTAYTRDEEREADRVGLDYMRRAGFDPAGAVRAWQRLSESAAGSLLPFLSTHPQAAERIETMKQMATE